MAKQEEPNWRRIYALALETAGGVVLGSLLGRWADRTWQTGSRYLLIGAGVGFVSGMYVLIKEAIRANKD